MIIILVTYRTMYSVPDNTMYTKIDHEEDHEEEICHHWLIIVFYVNFISHDSVEVFKQ